MAGVNYVNNNDDGDQDTGVQITYVIGPTVESELTTLFDFKSFNDGQEYSIINASLALDYEKYMRSGFFVHGRAGIFDEISYTDWDQSNNITPTK